MGWSDIAHFVRELGDVRSPAAERIVLVCDWVNTLPPASLHAPVPRHGAGPLNERREWRETYTHENWLNMAE